MDCEESDFVDVYDESGRRTGLQVTRSEAHSMGAWHQTIQCWAHWEDRGSMVLLFQRRSRAKAAWPGHLDASVAGHCRVGEEPEQACLRELWEEMGLVVDSVDLQYYGTRVVEDREGQQFNREFQRVYLINCEHSIVKRIRPSAYEVEAVVLVDSDRLMELLLGQASSIDAQLCAISNWDQRYGSTKPPIGAVDRSGQRVSARLLGHPELTQVVLADLIPDQLQFLSELCCFLRRCNKET